LRLAGGKSSDTHLRCREGGAFVGVDRRAVVSRESVFELVHEMRRKRMRLFDDPDSGLRRIRLSVVVGNRAGIAPGGRLSHRNGARLTPEGRYQGQDVFRADVVVDALSCRPIGEPRVIRRQVVVSGIGITKVCRKHRLKVQGDRRKLAGRDYVGWADGNRVTARTRGGSRAITVLVAAGAVRAIGRARCLRVGIIDGYADAAEVAFALSDAGKADDLRTRVRIAETVIVAEEEELIFP